MSIHRMYIENTPMSVGDLTVIEGDEAKHALRVKRVEPGDRVELLNGAGVVVTATVVPDAGPRSREKWSMTLRADAVNQAPRVVPRVHVRSATPKGPRLDDMIDGLSQAGAASWTPMHADRSVVDPRDSKLARVERIAVEASKQCSRAWVLEVGKPTTLTETLSVCDPRVLVIADGSGTLYEPRGLDEVTVLIGPEGGWTPRELEAARSKGVRIASFGPHVMRIETAAVVAVSVILAAEQGLRGRQSHPEG